MNQPAVYPVALEGLEPRWSRLITATDTRGDERTWHVLDSHADGPQHAPELTVVCVHGNPTWSYLWREVIAAADDRRRVVAIDHLDMGFSERTGTVRPLAQRIADLDTVISALAPTGPIVMVGHDWGGAIALGWARRHTERVVAVAVANTAVHQPENASAPSIIRLARSPGVLGLVAERTDGFIRGALAMTNAMPPEVATGFLAPYRHRSRRAAVAEFVRDIPLEPGHRSAATLDAIAAGLDALAARPTLLVWGTDDPVFSDLYLRDLRARLPHADVHRVEGSSHLVTEDVDFAGLLFDWLDQALGAPTAPAPPSPAATDRRPAWAALSERRHDSSVAIIEPAGASITFADLANRVERVAAAMYAEGIGPGSRVATMTEPGIDLITLVYACWRAGAAIVVADPGLGVRGLSRALRGAVPDVVVGNDKALAAARVMRWPGRRIATGSGRLRTGDASLAAWADTTAPPPPTPGPDTEAAVLFTSGATGPAKGVVYRHHQLETQRDVLAGTYRIRSDDAMVAAFAPFALYGPALGIASMVPDVDLVRPGRLTADALEAATEAIGATLVFASPASLRNVVATAGAGPRPSFASVRLVLSAGAPVPPALLRRSLEVFPAAVAHTPYGMTEVLPVADIDLAGIDRAVAEAGAEANGVCVGLPVAGVRIAISGFDAAGFAEGDLSTAAGSTGEVCVAAPHGKDRYDQLWRTERSSSRTEGWHRTGDVGHLDAEGRLWVEGRLGHVIHGPSGPVTPVAIELALEDLDQVAGAAAVGVGPRGTAQTVAVVSLAAPPDGAVAPPRSRRGPRRDRAAVAPLDLTDAARAAVADATGADLAAVLVVDALPVDRRHNAKIDRTALAAWAERFLAGESVPPP